MLGHKDHIQIEILLNNSLNDIVGLKITILEFYTQNRAQYPIYDETMQSMSLFEGKTTEFKQFFKSIILTPKIANKNIAFLFVLKIYDNEFYHMTSRLRV